MISRWVLVPLQDDVNVKQIIIVRVSLSELGISVHGTLFLKYCSKTDKRLRMKNKPTPKSEQQRNP